MGAQATRTESLSGLWSGRYWYMSTELHIPATVPFSAVILDTDGSCTSLSEAADRPPEVRRAAEARVAVHNERHVAGRPDALPCDFFHFNSCNYTGIRLAAACTHAEARQEQRLSASLGEDFRRQRVVDARAHDGSGRSQHISQLTSRADRAALRGCTGCKEQPYDGGVQAAHRKYECQGRAAMDAALLVRRPNTNNVSS